MSKLSNKQKTGIIIGVAVFVFFVILGVVDGQRRQPDGGQEDGPIAEAQEKCILMETADRVNYMGDLYDDSTTKAASDYCKSLWGSGTSEEDVIKIIESDWEARKEEVLSGRTLEELYNSSN